MIILSLVYFDTFLIINGIVFLLRISLSKTKTIMKLTTKPIAHVIKTVKSLLVMLYDTIAHINITTMGKRYIIIELK